MGIYRQLISMKKEIFLATHNEAKIHRFKNLLTQTGFNLSIYVPQDFGLEHIEVEENGKTLAENSEIKARAYFGKVNIPILANDTGFWVQGEGLIDAPKRTALGETVKENLTKKEIAKTLLDFWKNIATKHGGKVDAAWVEVFTLLFPDGTMRKEESKREIILTNQVFGESHIQFPMRALYISKTTNKPSVLHTKEEEILELKPITDALFRILSK